MRKFIAAQTMTSNKWLWIILIELIIMLWGVTTLFQLHEERYQSQQKWQRSETQWQVIIRSIKALALRYHATLIYEDSYVVGLRIQDTMSLSDWNRTFTDLQKEHWLQLKNASWRRYNDQWEADLTWFFCKPATLKPEQNWLPIDEQSAWPRAGELLTTLYTPKATALIKVDGQEAWYPIGQWLPALQATITHIEPEYITLSNIQGKHRQLLLTKKYHKHSEQGEP